MDRNTPDVIVFINCKVAPFIDWIMMGQKLLETRSRDTLGRLAGRRVYLAETGHGHPVVRCSVWISPAIVVRSREAWDRLYDAHKVPADSKYDWKPDTVKKCLYPVSDVQYVEPFPVPDGIRHGYVYMECPGK